MDKYINLTKAWGHLKFEDIKNDLNKKSFPGNETDAAEVAKRIKEEGIAIIQDYYSKDKCEALIEEFDRIDKENKAPRWEDKVKSDTRFFGSHLYSDLISEYYNDPFLKEIGERYLETELLNSHTLAGKLVPEKDNLGSGGGWHRDSVFIKQYKSIIYLTDVNLDNGPFEYILKTHHKSSIYKSIKNNGFKADQNRMTEKEIFNFLKRNTEFSSQINVAKKGTVILADTGGIHRGMAINSGVRYALTNYFFPVHQYTKSVQDKFKPYF